MKNKNKMAKHMDITLDYTPTPTQKNWLANTIGQSSLFSDNCIYVNGEYIGGRPNDRG